MPEGVSDRANKVYDAMKNAGMTGEDRMANADRITAIAKLPKTFVIDALNELQRAGYAVRKARQKTAGYFLTDKA